MAEWPATKAARVVAALIGPRMLAKIAAETGLLKEDL